MANNDYRSNKDRTIKDRNETEASFKQKSINEKTSINSANMQFIEGGHIQSTNISSKSNNDMSFTQDSSSGNQSIDSANRQFIEGGHIQSTQITSKNEASNGLKYAFKQTSSSGNKSIDSSNRQFIEGGHIKSRQSETNSDNDMPFPQDSSSGNQSINSANPQFIEGGHIQSTNITSKDEATNGLKYAFKQTSINGNQSIDSANRQFIEGGHIQSTQITSKNENEATFTQTSINGNQSINSANLQFIEGGHIQSTQMVHNHLRPLKGKTKKEDQINIGTDKLLTTVRGKNFLTTANETLDGKVDYPNITMEVDKKLDNSKEVLEKTNEDGEKLFDTQDMIDDILHDHGMYKNVYIYDNMYWWGYFDRRNYLNNTIEYVFFTKPDLHLTCVEEDKGDDTIFTAENKLIKPLENIPYFRYINDYYDRLIGELQISKNSNIVFSKLLFNQLISNVEIPSLEANTVETASNRYGVNLSYRGTSESSNDNFDFSLEFKDSKNLDIYHYFKVYEEYETLKHHGIIQPSISHIEKRTIHDAFSIYKFLVDQDASTIIYWCKYYGVIPKSLPRDTFSSSSFDSGLSYSINFKASFFEDMTPEILEEFNTLYSAEWNHYSGEDIIENELDIENRNNFHTNVNYTPVHAARVRLIKGDDDENKNNGKFIYIKNDGNPKSRFVLEFK